MNSLPMNIRNFKENLMDINVATIRKIKSKPIELRFEDTDENNLIIEYNYYVKLIKRIKKFIIQNKCKNIILRTIEDRLSNIICIAISIDKDKLDLGVGVMINIITGNNCSAYLDCTYYDANEGGLLYLNNFRSSKTKQGYGGIILSYLDEIVYSINENLNKMGYKSIIVAKGVMTPDKNIIKDDDLRSLYLKYDFSIESNNNIKRYIK
ncbi:MAG: hypothetical protein ACRC3Y_15155 [Romboutsia sp.]|uniref:hypothetical protein n=1 Tax=Romboutsia sp. TaxID=1965302 RepID=UPI003F323B4D